MGSQSVRAISSKADRKDFVQHLLNDIEAFQTMMKEQQFESNIQRIGAEQELCIVKNDFTPSYNALEILDKVNDEHLTTELGLFNLEINLDPYELKGTCFSTLESELHRLVGRVQEEAENFESDNIILTGILPTLRIKDLDFKYITPFKRYRTLNEVLKKIRGGQFKLHIMGIDELKLTHESILFEACNTSFQVHLQIDPKDAIDLYNWSQMIAGPVLSVMTNSPILLGKELWHETRIALFQQSIDLRSESHLMRGQKPRVSFGTKWVKDNISELFIDDVVRYAPIVTSDFDEDSMSLLQKGIMPKLKALNLHNGTLYKWNRLCYGVHKNVAHLRIENRYIPSGPTKVDEIANAMFWVGVMQGMPEDCREIYKRVKFKVARGNFINAARTGIESYFNWFGKEVSAIELIRDTLLPMARKGLQTSGVAQADIDKYLGIIESRIETRKTGSKWIKRNKTILSDSFSNYEINILLTQKMHEYQLQNIPVHLWKNIDEFPEKVAGSKNKAYKIMSRELFVVHEDDCLELIEKIMKWKYIHHVPVLDDENKIVGIVNEAILEQLATNNKAETTAKDIMNNSFVPIHPETSLEEMTQMIQEHNISSLAVIYKDELMGIVTKTDLAQAHASF
jgi:predicted transcriptional regulator